MGWSQRGKSVKVTRVVATNKLDKKERVIAQYVKCRLITVRWIGVEDICSQ